MFSCLQINCQPFYLRQLLKFHQFDWLIEIYLQTEGQGTHHKMVSLQPMSGFSPLLMSQQTFVNIANKKPRGQPSDVIVSDFPLSGKRNYVVEEFSAKH